MLPNILMVGFVGFLGWLINIVLSTVLITVLNSNSVLIVDGDIKKEKIISMCV